MLQLTRKDVIKVDILLNTISQNEQEQSRTYRELMLKSGNAEQSTEEEFLYDVKVFPTQWNKE